MADVTQCVIFDLDGTLADVNHRLHHLKKKPKDWEAFYSACVDDKCYAYLVRLCNTLYIHYPIFICSGRPKDYESQTIEWLQTVGIKCHCLMMRASGDHRPDFVIKKEMLRDIRNKGFDPLFAVDDRPTVVKMWRENGVPCLVVDDSNWAEEK